MMWLETGLQWSWFSDAGYTRKSSSKSTFHCRNPQVQVKSHLYWWLQLGCTPYLVGGFKPHKKRENRDHHPRMEWQADLKPSTKYIKYILVWGIQNVSVCFEFCWLNPHIFRWIKTSQPDLELVGIDIIGLDIISPSCIDSYILLYMGVRSSMPTRWFTTPPRMTKRKPSKMIKNESLWMFMVHP